MCTSFIKKENDNCIIAMNFDNNGMKYTMKTKNGWFIVYVIVNNGSYPSFGFHKSGIFFNNQMTNANEKGMYRRGKGVVHTSKFLQSIIDRKLCVNHLDEYLKQIEIVNVPNFSTHNMICDAQGNVWIIEPGIGNTYRHLANDDFQIITNVPCLETIKNDRVCHRYDTVRKLLAKNKNLDALAALQILNEVKQSGEWKTELSLVYNQGEEIIYYCENQDFNEIKKFVFE